MKQPQPSLFEPPETKYDATDFPFFHGAASLAANGIIADDWVPVLAPLDGRLREIAAELARRSAAGELILPEPRLMFRALTLPLSSVKVLILGQDPYPTPGHPIGLSFATDRRVSPLPRSLRNIYRELYEDLGLDPADHGDLSAWQDQGVMLLNQVLSVPAHTAGGHQKIGWDEITGAVLQALNRRDGALVAVLWGAKAQKLGALLPNIHRITSAHPSPLSASRGFFGSRPFSASNDFLRKQGATGVDWRLGPR